MWTKREGLGLTDGLSMPEGTVLLVRSPAQVLTPVSHLRTAVARVATAIRRRGVQLSVRGAWGDPEEWGVSCIKKSAGPLGRIEVLMLFAVPQSLHLGLCGAQNLPALERGSPLAPPNGRGLFVIPDTAQHISKLALN